MKKVTLACALALTACISPREAEVAAKALAEKLGYRVEVVVCAGIDDAPDHGWQSVRCALRTTEIASPLIVDCINPGKHPYCSVVPGAQ